MTDFGDSFDDKLTSLRDEIDEIDSDLVKLLQRRLQVTLSLIHI